MIYGKGNANKTNFPAYKHPLYWRWVNMISRCYNKKAPQYKSYGAKGVYVEDFLLDFANYVSFVSKLPNYDNLLCDPDKWQIDKDEYGGLCYSRKTIQIIPASKNIRIENSKKEKQVEMIDNNGCTIRVFSSFCQAEKETGISKRNISRASKNGTRAGKYFWRCL